MEGGHPRGDGGRDLFEVTPVRDLSTRSSLGGAGRGHSREKGWQSQALSWKEPGAAEKGLEAPPVDREVSQGHLQRSGEAGKGQGDWY